jgi:hypothetical protein
LNPSRKTTRKPACGRGKMAVQIKYRLNGMMRMRLGDSFAEHAS